MSSGIVLSGSDSGDNESNLLWVETLVSNNAVEKFGIPHFMYSHTIFIQNAVHSR